jgi:hypothetical protein
MPENYRSIEDSKKDQIIRLLKKLGIPYEEIPPIAIERITQKDVLGSLAFAEDGGFSFSEDETNKIRRRCLDIIGSVRKAQAKRKID